MLNIFKILFRLHDLGQFSQNFVRFSKIVASFCILRKCARKSNFLQNNCIIKMSTMSVGCKPLFNEKFAKIFSVHL